LVKRVVLGEREENKCEFLVETNGKLWYKSVNKNLGIHARDPKTLDVIISQEDIIKTNPFLANNLSLPEWNNILRYYGFDALKMMPQVSDNTGYVYNIDPVSLKAEKTSESINNFDFDNSCTSVSMKTDANSSIYLQGSPRNGINYLNKDVSEPSFLKGNFLKSSNMINPLEANPGFLSPYKEKIYTYIHQIDSIKKILENIDTSSADKFKKTSQLYSYKSIQRNIENLKNKIKYAEDDLKRHSDDELYEIVTKDNCVFVMSQSDVTDKAKVVISKIKLNKDSTVNLVWQTQLSDVYREPDKGFDQSSFDYVFSKGDPDLNTMRTVFYDDKLVFIFMLTATCIDTDSGNVIWSISL